MATACVAVCPVVYSEAVWNRNKFEGAVGKERPLAASATAIDPDSEERNLHPMLPASN